MEHPSTPRADTARRRDSANGRSSLNGPREPRLGVRVARPDEYVAVGGITVAAYQVDGLLAANPEYVHELSDAARRAAHGELLVAVNGADEVLGSVTVVRPGSPFAEISRDGELEFRMLSTASAARGQAWARR